MKRRLVLAVIVVTAFFSSGCAQKIEASDNSQEIVIESTQEEVVVEDKDTTDNGDEYIFEKPITENLGEGLVLAIDPKIESAYLVFEMVAYDTGFSQYGDSAYMLNQVNHFREFKNHEVFEIARRMGKNGFQYDAIPSALHFYDDDSKLREGIVLDEQILQRAGGIEEIDAFVNALVDFRKVSDYDSYFKSNNSFYENAMVVAKHNIEKSGLYDEFLKHYGYQKGSIRITITPDTMGGYGCSNTYDDHTDMMPTLAVISDEKRYAKFLLHEFSHPYVNPQTEVREDVVKKTENLFTPIKDQMARQAYNMWEVCLNEHIVRANTIYMMSSLYGGDIAEQLIQEEIKKGFVYIEPIYESIKNYENNRDKYKDFTIYFDTLMSDIEKIEPIS